MPRPRRFRRDGETSRVAVAKRGKTRCESASRSSSCASRTARSASNRAASTVSGSPSRVIGPRILARARRRNPSGTGTRSFPRGIIHRHAPRRRNLVGGRPRDPVDDWRGRRGAHLRLGRWLGGGIALRGQPDFARVSRPCPCRIRLPQWHASRGSRCRLCASSGGRRGSPGGGDPGECASRSHGQLGGLRSNSATTRPPGGVRLLPAPGGLRAAVRGQRIRPRSTRPTSTARPGALYVGHGAIDIAVARGTPVFVPKLEHQDGPAEVVYVGPLFGTTVVTLHSLREGAALREYLVLFAHLDAAAASVVAGKRVGADEPIGFVGDTGAPGLVHLHLEVRRVRAGVDVRALVRLSEGAGALVNDARTVACDPRNVLPLRVSSSVALP